MTAALILTGFAVGLLVAPAPPATDARSGQGLSGLRAPAQAFVIPPARAPIHDRYLVRWAPVLTATKAREYPSLRSPAVAPVSTRTPEGTTNLIVANQELSRDGGSWVQARLATLPNGRLGWVPRGALGGWEFVDTRVVVDRARLTLTLYRDGVVIFRAPVGIGKPSTPTPAGLFYVRDRLTGYRSPSYGPLAFGTSARSPVDTGWPAGGFIGIHGTDRPGLIPGRISHGCIRLRNAAILRLARLMPVGTPVEVQ
jgi:hypothetical protein